MSNTGVFFLRAINAEFAENGTIRMLRQVTVQCAACSSDSTLDADHGLVDICGAGVLTCPACGSRQAISRLRFEEFIRRFPQGLV
ncbi:hypothetical protein [Xanthomonas sp. 60]